jgi:hypothetical protein
MRRLARARLSGLSGLGDTAVVTDPATAQDSVINPPDVTPAQPVTRPVWIDPPNDWQNIDQLAYGLLPAIGATVVILSFQVPLGYNGVINRVACNFVGGGWVEGSGDVVWKILVDGGTPPGATSYANIVASLGSPANPVPISGFRIFQNQLLTVVGFNNPGGPDGGIVVAGQRLGARLMGFLYSIDDEDASTWV